MTENNGRSWTELFRVLTPLFLFLLSLIAGGISSKLNDMDAKLFRHLTNDELHCPRSMVVTKAEFSIYQSMRDVQMKDIKDDLSDIKKMMETHMGLLKGGTYGRKD
jgi:hypothetical protein